MNWQLVRNDIAPFPSFPYFLRKIHPMPTPRRLTEGELQERFDLERQFEPSPRLQAWL